MFRRYCRLLRGVASGILADDDLVDDVMQEAFARSLRANRQFGGEKEALNFVNRVVINTAIDFYRKRKRSSRVFRQVPNNWRQFESLGTFPPSDDDPLEDLLRRERRSLEQALLDEIKTALASLPQSQRQAIALLINRNGKSCRKVCAEAGIPYSTARSRMQGGLDKIRAAIRRGRIFRVLQETRNEM